MISAESKYRRRIRSQRGTAYMEFAMLMPFFIAMCSFLIEMCFYWDATVMANHTAYTIARIAKVNIKSEEDETYKKNPHVLQRQKIEIDMPEVQFNLLEKFLPSLKKSENLITIMMMGTTTMGFIPVEGATPGDIRSQIKTLVKNLFKSVFPKIQKLDGGSNPITKFFYDILNNIIDAINKVIDDIAEWVANLIGKIVNPLIDAFFDLLGDRGSRIFSQMYAAYQNVNEHEDVIEIDTIDSAAGSSATVINMTYPQHYNTKKLVGTTIDKPIHVAIRFPQTTNWIFSFFLEGTELEKPRAHGHAIMMPEPVLTEVHLKADEKAIEPPDENDNEDYETKYAEYMYLRKELPLKRKDALALISEKEKAYQAAVKRVNAIKQKRAIMQLEKSLKEDPDNDNLKKQLQWAKKGYEDQYQKDFNYDSLDASDNALQKAVEEQKEAKQEYDAKSGMYNTCKEVEFELWKWNWDREVNVKEDQGLFGWRRGSQRQVLIQCDGTIKSELKKGGRFYMNRYGWTTLKFSEKTDKYIYSIPLAGGYQALHPCCYKRDASEDWGGWCWQDRNVKKNIGQWPPISSADSTFPAKKQSKDDGE